MRGFLQRLVERLHDGERPLSRNKHFHVFTGSAKTALRIDRHLRDLEAHLSRMQARGERPRLRRLPDGGAQIVLSEPKLAVVRTAILSPEDTALLARSPIGAWALSESAEEADPAPISSAGGAKK